MFGFKPRLPVTDDERAWVDRGFERLSGMLGKRRMLECAVVQPTDEYFPDRYDGSEEALELLFQRVCGYMRVDRKQVRLAVLEDEAQFNHLLPQYEISSKDPAGLHFGRNKDGLSHIAVRASLMRDPMAAVATLAHELGHVILHEGQFPESETEDLEPMTDLVTVFLGLGIFTANCARRFKQWQDERRQGWSMKHLGYLPEVVYGYALARFAKDRGETRPDWIEHLSDNLKVYFRKSRAWLESEQAAH